MTDRRLSLVALIGLIVAIAGVSAGVMLSATAYMNGAAAYARAHLAELPLPGPLPGAVPYVEPPVRVEALARYWEANAVEVQITRRYKTLRHLEALFTVTYFYQPAPDGWRLVPPPASFWGEDRTTQGQRVVIAHPQRMQKIVDDLVAAIDAALAAACDQWRCPAGQLSLHLRFASDATRSAEPATFIVPEFTGVPLTHEASDDYRSSLAADAVRLAAAQLGKSPADAEAEVRRQKLYDAP